MSTFQMDIQKDENDFWYCIFIDHENKDNVDYLHKKLDSGFKIIKRDPIDMYTTYYWLERHNFETSRTPLENLS